MPKTTSPSFNSDAQPSFSGIYEMASKQIDAVQPGPPIESPGKRNVCNCFQITCEDMQRILAETNGANFETLKKYYQVGSRCTSCEYEIKDLITVYREEQQQAKLSVGGADIPLGRKVGAWFRGIKLSIRPHLTVRRFAIFVIRRDGFESSLTLSNLAFAEDPSNINGSEVSFQVTLFGLDGRVLAKSGSLQLRSDQSREYWLHELFPSVTCDLTGMIFVDYKMLKQVGSLRPYCCFNFGKRGAQYAGAGITTISIEGCRITTAITIAIILFFPGRNAGWRSPTAANVRIAARPACGSATGRW